MLLTFTIKILAAAARQIHTSQSSRSRRSVAEESHPKEDLSEESQFITEIKPKYDFSIDLLKLRARC